MASSFQVWTTARGRSPDATSSRTRHWTTSSRSAAACRGPEFGRRTSRLWWPPVCPSSTSYSFCTCGRRRTTTWTWPRVCPTVWERCAARGPRATCWGAWRRSAASWRPPPHTRCMRRCLSLRFRMSSVLKLTSCSTNKTMGGDREWRGLGLRSNRQRSHDTVSPNGIELRTRARYGHTGRSCPLNQ